MFVQFILSVLFVFAEVAADEASKVKSVITRKAAECTEESTAADQDFVHVHYVGKLQNGVTFDTSYARKQPLRFQLGAKTVIKVWSFFRAKPYG